LSGPLDGAGDCDRRKLSSFGEVPASYPVRAGVFVSAADGLATSKAPFAGTILLPRKK